MSRGALLVLASLLSLSCAGPAVLVERALKQARAGDSAAARGDLAAALDHYRTALEHVDEVREDHAGTKEAAGLHAGTRRIGQHTIATIRHQLLPAFELRLRADTNPLVAAHVIAKSLPPDTARAQLLGEIGMVYATRGDRETALRLVTDSVALSQSSGRSPNWRVIAEILQRADAREEAMLALSGAFADHFVRDWDRVTDHTSVREAFTSIAHGYVDAGDLAAARRAVAVATEAALRAPGEAPTGGAASDEALRMLALDCEIMGLHREGLQVARRIRADAVRLEPVARAAGALAMTDVLHGVRKEAPKLSFQDRLSLDVTLIDAYARVGEIETARAVARGLGRPVLRSLWTAHIATRLPGARHRLAWKLLDEAVALAGKLKNESARGRALARVAEVFAQRGTDRATERARRHLAQAAAIVKKAPSQRITLGTNIAKLMNLVGAHAPARDLMEAVVVSATRRRSDRWRLLLGIATQLRIAEAPERRVLELLNAAVASASGDESAYAARARVEAAMQALEAGLPAEALRYCDPLIDSPEGMRVVGEAGAISNALNVVARKSKPFERASLLLALARGMDAGEHSLSGGQEDQLEALMKRGR